MKKTPGIRRRTGVKNAWEETAVEARNFVGIARPKGFSMKRVLLSVLLLTLMLFCCQTRSIAQGKTAMIIINETNSTIHVTGHFDLSTDLDSRVKITDVPPRTRMRVNGVLVGKWQFYATNDQGRRSGPWNINVYKGLDSQLRFSQSAFPP